MHVRDLMTTDVFTCHADDSLEHAARLLWEHDCGCLPVVGEHGQIHGMITDRDICMAAYTSGVGLRDLQVREAMAIDATCVRPTTTLRAAELAMRDQGVRRLPVLDETDCVIGVLTCNDLARWVDDAGTIRRSAHDAVHLVRTLATIGRPRGASFVLAPESLEAVLAPRAQAPAATGLAAAGEPF